MQRTKFKSNKTEKESDDPYLDNLIEKIKFDKWPPDTHFEEEYKLLNPSLRDKGTLYDQALRMEIKDNYQLGELSPEGQLSSIKEQIKLRVKITALEVFKIGGLLIKAKQICQENKINWEQWLKDNVDFSHKTAMNFMHVYKYCLGFMSVAINLPPSLLYKIAEPSFPEELRAYLFEQGNINTILDMDLTDLVKQYKEKGIEAIKEKVETWHHDLSVQQQTQYVLDRYRMHLIDMQITVDRIRNRFGYSIVPNKGKQLQKELSPEANEVNKKLLKKLQEACVILGTTLDEVDDKLFNMDCANKDRLEL